MNELEDHLAQVLWKNDDDAPERSWGFVNMRRRGKYKHQARAIISELHQRPSNYRLVEHGDNPHTSPVTSRADALMGMELWPDSWHHMERRDRYELVGDWVRDD